MSTTLGKHGHVQPGSVGTDPWSRDENVQPGSWRISQQEAQNTMRPQDVAFLKQTSMAHGFGALSAPISLLLDLIPSTATLFGLEHPVGRLNFPKLGSTLVSSLSLNFASAWSVLLVYAVI